MDNTFISIQYNEREFNNMEEFKESLDKQYNYQVRPKWIAAAAEGGELWITIFINSGLSQFILGAITGGMLWDIIKIGSKKYILRPLFDSLEKLSKDNSDYGGLRILKLRFQFDNCEILIGGLNRNFTSIVSSVFNEISKMKPKFEKDHEKEVIKIELPLFYNPGIDKRGYSPYILDCFSDDYNLKSFKQMWKLTFENEHPVLVYDFNKNDYSNAYPNE